MKPTVDLVPELLRQHLTEWAGGWPPRRPVAVAANSRREMPGWDGAVHSLTGIVTDTGESVVGLPPGAAARVPAGIELADLLERLPEILAQPGRVVHAVFRWTAEPTPGPDEGVWVPGSDLRVPPWLYPFEGDVLLALEDGHYVAGVGVKYHDRFGHELAVVTRERARGRGIARRLVAQAARRVLAEGALPTYLHAADNLASARVAEAAGFPDRGWQMVGFLPDPPGGRSRGSARRAG